MYCFAPSTIWLKLVHEATLSVRRSEISRFAYTHTSKSMEATLIWHPCFYQQQYMLFMNHSIFVYIKKCSFIPKQKSSQNQNTCGLKNLG